ncbi:DUF2529 family protein [Metabacillus fastidiosus]|uniref:DUF2529 family protein n=1 Tax=Metabacillus fastidiosus TaxID=1458 RepID=A0ABU6P3C8_9BACI|nr:DUF2529 family protein [Metabacillus fastidiosus]MED4456055.1 DUF2529 family protein [Metabacillus fastidiosus]MED4534513.1 DUF2529 family protein [Metabacillus fastidiosus]
MMKIFTTQLMSYLKRITEQEELAIEDGSRLLAQASIGDGTIYFYGYKELEGVTMEATKSSELIPNAKPLFDENGKMAEVEREDRVILFTHRSSDEEAIQIAKELAEKDLQIVGVSAKVKDLEQDLETITDVHIDSKLLRPLIPDDDGSRYGFPALITSLFVYYAINFTLKEIMSEYE